MVATSFAGATEHLPALLLRFLLVLGIFAWWPRPGTECRVAPLHVLGPAVAMIGVVWGLLTAPNPGLALQDFVRVSLAASFFVVLYVSPTDRTRALLCCGLVVGSLHGVWALLERLMQATERAHAGFFNPTLLAAYTAPLALYALHQSIASATAKRRWIYAAGATFNALAVVMSVSRSGALALGLGGGVLLTQWFWHRDRRGVLLWGVVAVTLLAILGGMTAHRWRGENDPYAFTRAAIWRASAGLAVEEPLGVGLGNYENAMRPRGIAVDGPVRYPKVVKSPHSELLCAWVELGWPGILVLLTVVGGLLRVLWRSPDRGANLGIFVALALPAAVSLSLHALPIQLVAVVWAAQVYRRDPAPRPWPLVARWRDPLRRATKAWAIFSLALALPGVINHVLLRRAVALRDGGALPAALDHAVVAEAVAPWSLGTAMLAQNLRYRLGAPMAALQVSLMALAEQFPTHPRPLWVLARLLAEDLAAQQTGGKNKKAALVHARRADLLYKAVLRQPSNALIWIEVADALKSAGLAHQSRRALQQAVAVEPQCAAALVRLAGWRRLEGDEHGATVLLERARRAEQRARTFSGHAARILALDEATAKIVARMTPAPSE